MGVQLIFDDKNAFGLRKMHIHQVAHAHGPIPLGAPVGYLDMSPVQQWSKEHEQIRRTFPMVLIIVAFGLSGHHRQRGAGFADQLLWSFVKTDQWNVRIRRTLIEIQHKSNNFSS